LNNDFYLWVLSGTPDETDQVVSRADKVVAAYWTGFWTIRHASAELNKRVALIEKGKCVWTTSTVRGVVDADTVGAS
jgi:hypothetical protein